MGQDYELLILDRMVPGLDGLAVLKSLRASNNTTPALFLTALGEVDSRVEGFDAGGDDYLTKPFAFAELSARVNALGRRRETRWRRRWRANGVAAMAISNWTCCARRCERQGQSIDLMAKEFKLLEYFMRRPGRLGDAHHAAGTGLGHELRSNDQRGRNAYQPAAREDRQAIRRASSFEPGGVRAMSSVGERDGAAAMVGLRSSTLRLTAAAVGCVR
jgi:DNA-binding response OmpR family regulator